MKSKFACSVAAISSIAFLATSVPALAQTPSDLRDLVGARAAGGETALQSRGYSLNHATQGDDRTWGYWWNHNTRTCITVATMDGRFDSIVTTPASDCNQKTGNGSSDATAAAVAVGAAALIGAIALAHNSHHHDNDTHYTDQQSEADFERGYRDGLYGQSYHNPDNSSAYSSGYTSGVQQQGHETSYRSGHHNAGGYQPSVYVNDLVGARGSSANDQMESRGFRNVDGLKSGNSAYTIWYNSSTRQCLQMGVADGRVANIVDIGRSPGCR